MQTSQWREGVLVDASALKYDVYLLPPTTFPCRTMAVCKSAPTPQMSPCVDSHIKTNTSAVLPAPLAMLIVGHTGGHDIEVER